MKRIALFTIGIVISLALAAPAVSAEEIKTIIVEGNSKTRDETVILISGLEVGEDFALDSVSEIEAKLVDSGLFKDVGVQYTAFEGGLKIIITAEDKHSWVIAPTYYNQPTNKGGGIGFGENNLFGENKKLLVYTQIATGDSFFVAGYIDPAIRGSRFSFQGDVYLLRERTIEYAPPDELFDDPVAVRESKLNYLNGGFRFGVNMFGGFSFNARLRGAKVFYDDTKLAGGAMIEDVTGDPSSNPEEVPEPGDEGMDISTQLRVDFDSRANWYGISHGSRLRLSFERSLTALGSDFDYWNARVEYERARRHFERHNSVLKVGAAYGDDMPFHAEFTAGGTNLRGYKNDQFRGNVQINGNFEYSVPTVEVKGVSLRLLAFFDTSYTTFANTEDNIDVRNYLPGHDAQDETPFKNTVGVGTRLFIRQIVLPLLGLDVGYGIERNSFEVYLAIGLTDV